MNKHEKVNDVNDHESVNELNDHDNDPFKRHMRSMGHARIPITPSPEHLDEPVITKPKHKLKKKPKIKIIKEIKYGIHHRWKSTNRKCSLSHETFKSARELSAHVKEKHKYKFLCRFCKCKSVGYASKNSVDRHSQHHSSPCYICATCGKQFHEKYHLEAHINIHDSEKFFDCVYPKCTRRHKSKVEYNQHVKLTHTHSPSSHAQCATRDSISKNIWMNTSKHIQTIIHRSALIVTNDTSGVQCGCTHKIKAPRICKKVVNSEYINLGDAIHGHTVQ